MEKRILYHDSSEDIADYLNFLGYRDNELGTNNPVNAEKYNGSFEAILTSHSKRIAVNIYIDGKGGGSIEVYEYVGGEHEHKRVRDLPFEEYGTYFKDPEKRFEVLEE